MPIAIIGNPPVRLLEELEERFSRLAHELGAHIPARAGFPSEHQVVLEAWMGNECFIEEGERADDTFERLRERLLQAWSEGLLKSDLDVHEFCARSRSIVRTDDGSLTESPPALRFTYRLSRPEALARLRLSQHPFLLFFDHASGRNGVLFTLGTNRGGPFFLYLEDPDELAGFDRRDTFKLRCEELDGAAEPRGKRIFMLPVIGSPDSYEVLLKRIEQSAAPVVLGRRPNGGTPCVAVLSGDRLWVHDYVHANEDLVLERIEGFPPAEVVERGTDASLDEPVRTWRDILQCPVCQTPLDVTREERIDCPSCQARFAIEGNVPHFLCGDETPPALQEGEEWLMNPLPKVLPYFLLKYPRGLVLDCGSGNTPLAVPNLVNLEVFRFPNTTVVASGDRLPFRDESFDAVLSAAVLEHVPDPFAYCREILRVLKPGGEVRIDSAFLQPYHACPDHYFGTTRSGLRAAAAGFQPVAVDVGEAQSPFVALQTFLNAYASAIPDEEHRKQFRSSSINELLNLHPGPGPNFVRIPPNRAGDLAAGVYLHGIKPRPQAAAARVAPVSGAAIRCSDNEPETPGPASTSTSRRSPP